jgi:hypothetical protein
LLWIFSYSVAGKFRTSNRVSPFHLVATHDRFDPNSLK